MRQYMQILSTVPDWPRGGIVLVSPMILNTTDLNGGSYTSFVLPTENTNLCVYHKGSLSSVPQRPNKIF